MSAQALATLRELLARGAAAQVSHGFGPPPVSSHRFRVPADFPLVLVSCSDTKRATGETPAPARTVYTSPLFRLSLAYARTIAPDDRIRIISARWGAIGLDQPITSYEFRLQSLRRSERETWGVQTVADLTSDFGYGPLRVIVLAGETYVEALRYGRGWHARGWRFELPLDGLRVGERLAWLKRELGRSGARTYLPSAREEVGAVQAYLEQMAADKERGGREPASDRRRIARVLRDAARTVDERGLRGQAATAYLDELAEEGTRYFDDIPDAERYRDLGLAGNALPAAIRGIERGKHLAARRAFTAEARP